MITVSAINHPATAIVEHSKAAATAYELYGECFLVSFEGDNMVFQVGQRVWECTCGDCDECDA